MNWLLKSKFFYLGLVLRLCIMPFFGSSILKTYFIPFLDDAVLHFGINPWSIHPPQFFPYGSSIFLLLYIPRLVAYKIFGASILGTGFLSIGLFKVPLLIIDTFFLYIFTRLAPNFKNKVVIFYWLNPVLFYITYIYGQLDLISTTFVFIAILSIIRKKIILSATAMAIAILAKFHVIIILPFLLVYMWNSYFAKEALKKISIWFFLIISIIILGFIPLIKANQLIYIGGGSPDAQKIFAAQMNLGSGQVVYLGVGIVLALLGRLCLSTRFSERGLIYGSGLLFGVLVLITNPMPGWYFWVFPFIILFFIHFSSLPKSLFIFINIFFFVHFCILSELKIEHGFFWSGISLTLLQTSLASFLFLLWNNIVKSDLPIERRSRPFIIGIAGDSGAGKNLFSTALFEVFGGTSSATIEGDDYHKWERGHDNWQIYTHLNPRANHLDTLQTHVRKLQIGQHVFQPHYDHHSGNFTKPRGISPSKTILIQGLHTFYLKNMRSSLDLKIFLAPHELVRIAWKIKRDSLERRHSIEKVLESLNKRAIDSDKHIAPQRLFADWIIEFMPKEPISMMDVLSGTQPELCVKHTLWNDIPLDQIVHHITKIGGCDVQIESAGDDLNRIILKISGEPDKEKIKQIAEITFPQLRTITRSRTPPIWRSGFEGINQLLALVLIQEKV